jgi:hypothetical protein
MEALSSSGCQQGLILQRRLQLRQKPLGLALAGLPGHSEKCGCGTGGKTHVRVDHKISVMEFRVDADASTGFALQAGG